MAAQLPPSKRNVSRQSHTRLPCSADWTLSKVATLIWQVWRLIKGRLPGACQDEVGSANTSSLRMSHLRYVIGNLLQSCLGHGKREGAEGRGGGGGNPDRRANKACEHHTVWLKLGLVSNLKPQLANMWSTSCVKQRRRCSLSDMRVSMFWNPAEIALNTKSKSNPTPHWRDSSTDWQIDLW